jgi:hypothetical protein
MMNLDSRQLKDLEGVGKECLRDFATLGITSVKDLSKRDPEKLYRELERLTGKAHDICVLDMLRCAVAQAKNPRLPKEMRKWWYWSKKRKETHLR